MEIHLPKIAEKCFGFVGKSYNYISRYSLIACILLCISICDTNSISNNFSNYSSIGTIENQYKINVVNFLHMKRGLLKEGFDEQSIAKLTYNLSQHLGWEWYDQSASLKVEYTMQLDKKFITKAIFNGMNQSITLDYNLMVNSKEYNKKPDEKEFVVMRGIITSNFENMLFNSQEIPSVLQKNVMKFSKDSTFAWNKGDKFACLYDSENFKVMAISLSSNSKKKYAIAFKGKKKQNIFNLDGIAWKSEKLVFHKPVNGRITSHFGYRIHPVLKIHRFHYGVDYGAPRGAPIYAAASGKIKFAGHKGGYGYCVEIKHDNNISTLYAHMQRIDKSIYVGKQVQSKEVIGKIGSSGLATGPHLHYEINVNGTKVNPITYSANSHNKLQGEELKTFKQYANRIVKYLA